MEKRTYQDRKEYLKAYYKEYYKKAQNKIKILEKQKKQDAKNRIAYNEWKKTLKCSLCNENESCCLEFHHINPDEKSFTISERSSLSLKSIQKEANKCIVVCSNCHKKIHAGLISAALQSERATNSLPS